MVRHRTHSIEFKRQVAQEYLSSETLHGLAKRHDVTRNLIRVWVRKYEEGAFDGDARAADLIQEYEARIAPPSAIMTARSSPRASGRKRGGRTKGLRRSGTPMVQGERGRPGPARRRHRSR
ncbi:transposase [Aquibium sp. LZ166]|uniref:Transposase n=1 Tax=Aquibium pacificus TaxID=3153579 RepID=A0ABV3SMA1_9HYPH